MDTRLYQSVQEFLRAYPHLNDHDDFRKALADSKYATGNTYGVYQGLREKDQDFKYFIQRNQYAADMFHNQISLNVALDDAHERLYAEGGMTRAADSDEGRGKMTSALLTAAYLGGFKIHTSEAIAGLIASAVMNYKDPARVLLQLKDYGMSMQRYIEEVPPDLWGYPKDPELMGLMKPLELAPIGSYANGARVETVTQLHHVEELELLTRSFMTREEEDQYGKKEMDAYRAGRDEAARGQHTALRKTLLDKNIYALNRTVYAAAWDAEALRDAQYTYREKVDRGQGSEALIDMKVHTLMAKAAAEMVPTLLRQHDYSLKFTVESMVTFLGRLADAAYAGAERMIKLHPYSWRDKDNFPDDQLLEDLHYFDSAYEVTIPDEIIRRINREQGEREYAEMRSKAMPVIQGIKTKAYQEAHQQLDRFKLNAQREKNAMGGRIEGLEEEVRKLKTFQEDLKKEAVRQIKENKAALQAQLNQRMDLNSAYKAINDSGNRLRLNALHMAYGACADHIRERLSNLGQDTSGLKSFPSLAQMKEVIERQSGQRKAKAFAGYKNAKGEDYQKENEKTVLDAAPETIEAAISSLEWSAVAGDLRWCRETKDMVMPESKARPVIEGETLPEQKLIAAQDPSTTMPLQDVTLFADAAVGKARTHAMYLGYAACADHLRKRLTAHGIDPNILADLPNLQQTQSGIDQQIERTLQQSFQKLKETSGREQLKLGEIPELKTPENLDYIADIINKHYQNDLADWIATIEKQYQKQPVEG